MLEWKLLDKKIGDKDVFARNYFFSDFSSHVKARTTFVAAIMLRPIAEGLILVNRLDDARRYALATEKHARNAIKYGQSSIKGRKLDENYAKGEMWYLVYLSRWLLDGFESANLLRQAFDHAFAAVEADAGKRRKKEIVADNKARLCRFAMHLGEFELAQKYSKAADGPVDWSGGCQPPASERLFARIVSYMSKSDDSATAREEIITSFQDLFQRLRSGTMDPLENDNWLAAINLSRYGLKYFEELREGRPFTYEEAVRAIRYAPSHTEVPE